MTVAPALTRPTRVVVLAAALLSSACVMAPPQRHYPGHSPGGPYGSREIASPPVAQAAPMYFYPERGQPDALQDRDRYECYRWGVRESGVDPGMTPIRQPYAYAAPARPLRDGRDGADVVGGAATGAVLGAAMSSPRHAGQNAVIGAVFGALLGAAAQESRAQAIENAQARRQAAAETAQMPLDNFRRAMSACMRGRGYRIG